MKLARAAAPRARQVGICALGIWALLAAGALASCADELQTGSLEKPVAPVMPTLGAYAAPTAPLTLPALGELLPQVATLTSAVDALGVERSFLQSLQAGLAQLEQQGAIAPQAQPVAGGLAVQRQALTVQGDGYLEVWRICDGWELTPAANLANGQIQLNAGFDEQGLDPIVWGTVRGCRYRMGEHFVQLDGTALDPRTGDIRIFIGRNVQIASLGSFPDPVLVELTTRALLDNVEITGSLNFRIDVHTRALELLIPLGAGYVLVAVDGARGGNVLARATNGTFNCEIAARRCTGPAGELLSVP